MTPSVESPSALCQNAAIAATRMVPCYLIVITMESHALGIMPTHDCSIDIVTAIARIATLFAPSLCHRRQRRSAVVNIMGQLPIWCHHRCSQHGCMCMTAAIRQRYQLHQRVEVSTTPRYNLPAMSQGCSRCHAIALAR